MLQRDRKHRHHGDRIGASELLGILAPQRQRGGEPDLLRALGILDQLGVQIATSRDHVGHAPAVYPGAMRGALATSVILSLGIGCGGGGATQPVDAAPIDTPAIDAPPACKPAPLLVGGTDVAQQGWTVIKQGSAAPIYGAAFVQLDTTMTGTGQLLLALPGAVTATDPFKIAIVMKVSSVSPHQPDPLDAAVAIMPSLTGMFGSMAEREQMISIESGKISCADGTPSATVNLVDSAFHTYTLTVDAAHTMTFTIDGQPSPTLTRDAVTIDGTIAIGDQTNDTGFDASMQIRSVTKLCL